MRIASDADVFDSILILKELYCIDTNKTIRTDTDFGEFLLTKQQGQIIIYTSLNNWGDKMSNIKLVLLGLLCEKPMHGYEIKHIIEDHMGDWTDIKFGSIYFALTKLAEEQAVEIAEEGREGNRPARTVYQITQKGKDEYNRLLRGLWASDSRTYYSFDVGLFFIGSLPKEEAAGYFDKRIHRADESIAHLKRHSEVMLSNPHIPAQARAIISHTLRHMEAERSWLTEVKERLNDFY